MKVFYFVLTSNLTWGKAVNLNDALKAAQVKPSDKKIEYIINIGVCKKDTPDEVVKNLVACFGVTGMGAIQFYENPSPEDKKQAEDYFLGWATDESFVKPKESKTKKSK